MLIQRILVLAASLLSCIYGLRQIRKGFKRKYFIVSLCGMLAIFLSEIYCLVIVLSVGNDDFLTIGNLGQASAYLFFLTANLRFLSHSYSEKVKNRICAHGAFGVALLGVALIMSALKIDSAFAYIREMIYLLSMGSSFYLAANTVTNRKYFDVCRYVTPFNCCLCGLIMINGLSEVANAYLEGQLYTVTAICMATVCALLLITMLPVLKMGMKSWRQ